MKKIFTSLLVAVMVFVSGVGSVFATSYDTTKLDQAYQKIVAYYQTHKTLSSPDEIIAVEALGLEAEDGFVLPDLASQDFETASSGDLTKSIIAFVLIGKDPTNINGQNLISILEGQINDDGSVKNSNGSTTDIWTLFALQSVSSQKATLVSKHLANDANTDGGYWYEYNGKISSPDTTGWAIEALSLADKNAYTDSIQNAMKYIAAQKKPDGSYGSAPSGDTQACILEGFFVYDKATTLSTYGDAIDVLLSFQLEDGSFKSAVYDADYYPTGEYAFNAYTTMEAARCLGTYQNGSFVNKAQKAYQGITAPKTEETTKPEVTPTKQPTKTKTKTKAVETADETNIALIAVCMIGFGSIFLFMRKRNENNY